MLCLGTAISGMSVMAMEKKEKCEIGQHSDANDKSNVDMGEDIYIREYKKLISTYDLDGKTAEKAMRIFKKEIESGKNEDYADKYSYLIAANELDEEITRKILEIYEEKIKAGKGQDYAYKYAELKSTSKLSEERIDNQASIYEKQIQEEKS